jgi:hypothetical protein
VVIAHDSVALEALKSSSHSNRSNSEAKKNGRITPPHHNGIELMFSQNPTILLRMFASEDVSKFVRSI